MKIKWTNNTTVSSVLTSILILLGIISDRIQNIEIEALKTLIG